ncbi:hypothetical protein [Myxosarcina sp. GI1]|uniref:hypothetical protein n=1 Tax=Myxosarcina sp. GI1 TaxID=1541065 RepID=UPI0012E0AFF8|nr:hypothetical protein [Myxosarcina sp. GI1]
MFDCSRHQILQASLRAYCRISLLIPLGVELPGCAGAMAGELANALRGKPHRLYTI